MQTLCFVSGYALVYLGCTYLSCCSLDTYLGTTRYKYDLLYIHGRHNEKFEDTRA
jgi:hypothetical protein